MEQTKILLIFKDGIVNLGDVAALAAAPKSAYVYVHIRNSEKHLLFKVFDRNCNFEAERQPRDLLVSVSDIAARASNRKHGNFPLCLGFFGDGHGNVEIDIVNSARFASDKNIGLIPSVNASPQRSKFHVGFIHSLYNGFKAFRYKFFKFHRRYSGEKNNGGNPK